MAPVRDHEEGTHRKARVAHVITGLDVGGAERVLISLLRRTPDAHETHSVISLQSPGDLASEVRELGVQARTLRLTPLRYPLAVPTLRAWFRRERPDVVQTWMYHADAVGGLAARAAGIRGVAWGLHAGPRPPRGANWKMDFVLPALARASHVVPDTIVCCSATTKRVHLEAGYDPERMVVIRNGFEVQDEHDVNARSEVRRELGMSVDAPLVLWVGRFHPQKDLETMAEAAGLIVKQERTARIVVCGSGLDAGNAELRGLLQRAQALEHTSLLGVRGDPGRLYAAADLVFSSSAFGEGLPMVLGEAMASGTPVVATDVGDSADLVDDPVRVVPPRDAGRLAAAVLAIIKLDKARRLALGERDRARVAAEFSLAGMAAAYQTLYRDLAARYAPSL